MECPYCQHHVTRVLDKRDNSESKATRRRRECLKCGKRVTTYERIENLNLQVIKRLGNLEEFNRAKLKRGILRAVKKRPITNEQIDELIEEIELKLLNRKTTYIKSTDIGKMVLTRLKKLDKLSYILFCAVYNDFSSLEDLKLELHKLDT